MIIDQILAIAQHAGEIIMPYFKSNDLDIHTKRNMNDPVTAADFASDKYIKEQLSILFPDDYILTEETANNDINRSGTVRIVDPLDGTKNFIHQNNNFCVMIGRCTNGTPDLGVIYFPATEITYYAQHGGGAYVLYPDGKQALLISVNDNEKTLQDAVIHCSKGNERFVLADEIVTDANTGKKIIALQSAHCLGYSDCLIASGDLDVMITFHNRTAKRDTCAPQIILQETGGIITNIDGSELDYTQEASYWELGHVACSKTLHPELIAFFDE